MQINTALHLVKTRLFLTSLCMLILLNYAHVAHAKAPLNNLISSYLQYMEKSYHISVSTSPFNMQAPTNSSSNLFSTFSSSNSLSSGSPSATASGLDSLSLTKAEADKVTAQLLASHAKITQQRYGNEWTKRKLSHSSYSMPFTIQVFGKAPASGRSMYISLHGGGGTTADVNNQQWENQKRLYSLKEGVYFVPRSPTDTWNMWHQYYMDGFIQKAIDLAVIHEGVDPNKVYVMGYSAGGDGIYQLATRMPDLFAAAAMSAGHPGDAHIENLLNLPFGLYMGGQDSAYDRNKLAHKWKNKLETLARETGAYVHDVHIFPQFGHWMEKKDAISIPWMATYTRNPIPHEVYWIQDDVLRDHFYWLSTVPKSKHHNAVIKAFYNKENTFVIEDETKVKSFIININDSMCDLDKNIKIYRKDKLIFDGIIPRYEENIKKDIHDGRDAYLIFPAKILIDNMKATILGS